MSPRTHNNRHRSTDLALVLDFPELGIVNQTVLSPPGFTWGYLTFRLFCMIYDASTHEVSFKLMTDGGFTLTTILNGTLDPAVTAGDDYTDTTWNREVLFAGIANASPDAETWWGYMDMYS